MNSLSKTRSRSVLTLAGFSLLVALLVTLEFSSLQAMWRVWGGSGTYTHGYLVFPVFVYLIYLNRAAFARAPHEPLPSVTVAVIVCGLIWVISALMNVHVVGQLMLVSTCGLLCLSYFGIKKTSTILFPLAYLFFAVPMGEGLVPKLMEFTADFTVWALRVTGLPVFRDGMYFSIPAGDFEVAHACSGIRYLMASFALGTLYAYLSFRSLKKQVIFCAMSLLVPIIANGIRAYGIVMIAHFSGMKYAVGFDHLIYGWLFFGLVMFLLFYVGGKFRSAEDMEVPALAPAVAGATMPSVKLRVTAILLAAALVLPHLVGAYVRQANSNDVLLAKLPAASQSWQGPGDKVFSFEPNFSAAVSTASGHYRLDQSEVYLWVYRYPAFDSNHEMITETNTLADLKRWAVYQQRSRSMGTNGELSVIETELGDRREEYTVWYWYQLNDTVTNGRVKAKLAEGKALLSGSLRVNQALVVLVTPERGEEAAATLEKFVKTHEENLLACASKPDATCAANQAL